VIGCALRKIAGSASIERSAHRARSGLRRDDEDLLPPARPVSARGSPRHRSSLVAADRAGSGPAQRRALHDQHVLTGLGSGSVLPVRRAIELAVAGAVRRPPTALQSAVTVPFLDELPKFNLVAPEAAAA